VSCLCAPSTKRKSAHLRHWSTRTRLPLSLSSRIRILNSRGGKASTIPTRIRTSISITTSMDKTKTRITNRVIIIGNPVVSLMISPDRTSRRSSPMTVPFSITLDIKNLHRPKLTEYLLPEDCLHRRPFIAIRRRNIIINLNTGAPHLPFTATIPGTFHPTSRTSLMSWIVNQRKYVDDKSPILLQNPSTRSPITRINRKPTQVSATIVCTISAVPLQDRQTNQILRTQLSHLLSRQLRMDERSSIGIRRVHTASTPNQCTLLQ
jgi:hypothetical protein